VPSSSKIVRLVLPSLLVTAGLGFQTAGPARAAFSTAGVMTGWEDASGAVGPCGLPQTGFEFSGSTFVFRDIMNPLTFQSADVEIGVGAYLAAPQGAAPGGCQPGAPLAPMVPAPVPLTSVKVGGAACALSPIPGDPPTANTYTRINTTVSITFSCTPTSGTNQLWQIEGNQTVCNTDPLGFGVPPQLNPNPECNADPSDADQEDAAGYEDPFNPAGSHFIVVYSHT
jgi:hypothetical protein